MMSTTGRTSFAILLAQDLAVVPLLFLISALGGNSEGSVVQGVMVALVVDSKEKVDTVYKKALELGGKDEGPAGPRGDGFYAGYFRDPDGNKLNAFCMVAPETAGE